MSKLLAADSMCEAIIGRRDAATHPIRSQNGQASRTPTRSLSCRSWFPRCHPNLEHEIGSVIGHLVVLVAR